jgi:hypothetical protein
MFIHNIFVSTYFGHHYAHRQENQTVFYRIWCSAMVVRDVAVRSWEASRVHWGKVVRHTARVPDSHRNVHHNHCRTPYAVEYSPVLLTMGIMMPEIC